jgi:hypothetical protein
MIERSWSSWAIPECDLLSLFSVSDGAREGRTELGGVGRESDGQVL